MNKKTPVLLLSFFVLCLCSCATKMTLEEAQKTAVSISGQAADVPHRRINDIVAILDQPGHFDSHVVNSLMKKTDEKLPPQAASRDYYARGQAAWELGRYQQGIADLRKAVALDRGEPIHNYMPYLYLCLAEKKFGNFRTAMQLCEDSLNISSTKSTGTLYNLAVMYAILGKMDKAAEMQNRLDSWCRRVRDSQDALLCDYRKASLSAFLLEFSSQSAQAESLLRERIGLAKGLITEYPSIMVETKMDLAENLIRQKRFTDAEIQIRQALQENLALVGVNSPLTAEILRIFGNIFIAQGRIDDAEKITARAIRIGGVLESSQQSVFAHRARAQAGNLLVMRGSFGEALQQYNLAKDGLRNYQYQQDQYIANNPFYKLALIMTGNAEDVAKAATIALDEANKKLIAGDYGQAVDRALLGMIGKRQGNIPAALHAFAAALPVLESSQTNASDYARTRLLGFVIDDYIDLLAQIKEAKREKELGIDATDVAFKLAETARRHSLQGDIAASSVRGAATSPALAELVRKEQDAEKTIGILQANLSDLLAAPADEVVEKGIKTVNERMGQLIAARSVIREEIKKNYSNYDNFINPSTPSLAATRVKLRKGEALISIHSTGDKSYIWAVPYQGEVRFAISPIGSAELKRLVSELRRSLDCQPLQIGDIPEFNATLAYELYSRLLKPVEDVWKKELTDLLIVPSPAIGQLPLSVLLTEPAPSDMDGNVLFDKYKNYPWLMRKVSLAVVPSASSLVMLRNVVKKDDAARKTFIGFGDPIFTKEQLARADEKGEQITLVRRGAISVRGVRIMDKGSLDNDRIESANLNALNRLPDTAEELKNIAQALNADQDKDVLLGLEATKTNVMTMNLRNRKIIAFATHALVPGDLDGLQQPALALSPSAVTGKENDNGLLAVEDILKLNLNSDWVVLSACNTAAAGGAGADALTGLCRAFFYAGTETVLASMYPVETTSARKLVTNLFENQGDSQIESRARALQRSMLNLMAKENLIDKQSGKIAASYAHPFFWAPFIIVGESGLAP
jgi:CHAT domain-containing protein